MKLSRFSFSKLQLVRRTSWQQGSNNQSKQVGTRHPRSVVDSPCSSPKVGELAGHNCTTAASFQKAVSLLGKGTFDLVVTDLKTEGSDPGQIAKNLKDACPSVRVMILSHRRIEKSIPAADYLAVIPCSPKKLQDSIRRALSKRSSRLPRRRVLAESRLEGNLRPEKKGSQPPLGPVPAF